MAGVPRDALIGEGRLGHLRHSSQTPQCDPVLAPPEIAPDETLAEARSRELFGSAQRSLKSQRRRVST